MGKTRKAFEIFLGAGSGCNMRCKYCFAGHQDCSQTRALPVIARKALRDRVEGLSGVSDKDKVVIWGGEPLHNAEALRLAVGFVREVSPDIIIQIPTNGLALTPAWVDYLNDNRIMITISHDGSGQEYRGYDILQDPKYLDLLRNLNKFNSCHYVMHRYNANILDIEDYFNRASERLGKQIQITGSVIRSTNDYTLPYLPVAEDGSIEKVCLSAVHILKEGLAGHNLHYNAWLLRKFNKYISCVLHGDDPIPTKPPCGAGGILCMDLLGREYLCHAEAEATASDPKAPTVTNDNYQLDTICHDCGVRSLCGGICSAMPKEYRAANCEFYRAWHATQYSLAHILIDSLSQGRLDELLAEAEKGKEE